MDYVVLFVVVDFLVIGLLLVEFFGFFVGIFV